MSDYPYVPEPVLAPTYEVQLDIKHTLEAILKEQQEANLKLAELVRLLSELLKEQNRD